MNAQYLVVEKPTRVVTMALKGQLCLCPTSDLGPELVSAALSLLLGSKELLGEVPERTHGSHRAQKTACWSEASQTPKQQGRDSILIRLSLDGQACLTCACRKGQCQLKFIWKHYVLIPRTSSDAHFSGNWEDSVFQTGRSQDK